MAHHFTLTLTLETPFRDKVYKRAVHLDPDTCSEMARAVNEMQMGVGSFGDTVTLMKRREFRRAAFVQTAKNLAQTLADYMEDAEGWHGADRQERVREIIKKDSR